MEQIGWIIAFYASRSLGSCEQSQSLKSYGACQQWRVLNKCARLAISWASVVMVLKGKSLLRTFLPSRELQNQEDNPSVASTRKATWVRNR